jgi:hypothetical protein
MGLHLKYISVPSVHASSRQGGADARQRHFPSFLGHPFPTGAFFFAPEQAGSILDGNILRRQTMPLQPKTGCTFEDYLAAEREEMETRHEYVRGEVFAMVGATLAGTQGRTFRRMV